MAETLEVLKLSSQKDLPLLVAALKNRLSSRSVFLFIGEVGSGKTTTVAALAEDLGMSLVASPSFAIHHRYENSQGKTLDHVDLYRIKDEEDLESTGFWDLFAQPEAWVIVEWADHLDPEVWPLQWDVYRVQFFRRKDEEREIQIVRA